MDGGREVGSRQVKRGAGSSASLWCSAFASVSLPLSIVCAECRVGGVSPVKPSLPNPLLHYLSHLMPLGGSWVGVRWSRAEKALELLALMRHDGVRPDVVVYTSVMDACAKAGKLRRPAAASRQRGRRPGTTTTGSGSSSGSSSGEPVGVDEVIAGMWRATNARTGPERALELLEEMRADGIQPNGRTFGTAITACASRGLWRRALALLATARGMGYDLGRAAVMGKRGGGEGRGRGWTCLPLCLFGAGAAAARRRGNERSGFRQH